jgi:hypothetical protein
MANAEGYVLPKPGIPKTLGILNVIFGVLLTLGGFCMLVYMAVLPAIVGFAEKSVKDVQTKVEAKQKADLKSFEDREKAATTEEEKKAIQQEREAFVANSPPTIAMDMSAATDALKDPVVMGYTYVNFGTGAILSVILLISGIGLIRLAPWGRSTAIVWAGLQILQLVVLAAANILYVQPIQQQNAEKILAKVEAEAKAGKAAPGLAESVKLSRAMSSNGVTTLMSLGFAVVGSIYPVIVLILLSTPGAKAALLGPKPDGGPGF